MRRLKQLYREWYVRTHCYPQKHPMPKYLWSLVAVMALWAAVMEMDYQDQLTMERAAREVPTAYQKALMDCMSAGANGERGGFYMVDSKKSFECQIREM